jgi:hypothetical protein
MSRFVTGVFGAIAVLVACGAVQLALGRDLTGLPRDSFSQKFRGKPEAAVNRAAKADRAAGVTGSPTPTRTISLQLDGLADTSILVRIPVVKGESGDGSAPSAAKPGESKVKVACEPVVSALVEIAKRLQPGRCVT